MDFGEKKVRFSRREMAVTINAFREAANDRMHKGSDPFWHLGMLAIFENMQARHSRELRVSEDSILRPPFFKDIVRVIDQYANNTQKAVTQLTNIHPKNEVDLPLQRKYNGDIAESMVLEFKIACSTPVPIPAPEADKLVSEFSEALRIATADDFGARS